MVVELNEADFESKVLKSDKPVVVDFWAPWCGPCKMIAPVFTKVAGEIKDVVFMKVNVDENQGLAQQVGILGIPCMVVFKDGGEVGRIVGYQTEEKLKDLIRGYI